MHSRAHTCSHHRTHLSLYRLAFDPAYANFLFALLDTFDGDAAGNNAVFIDATANGNGAAGNDVVVANADTANDDGDNDGDDDGDGDGDGGDGDTAAAALSRLCSLFMLYTLSRAAAGGGRGARALASWYVMRVLLLL
jgi:hypothetical protein